MTRYSRSVIPGRSNGDGSNPAEIDRLVFGQKGRAPSADNDVDDDDDDDDDDDIDESEAAELKGRANKERRSKVDRRVVKSRRKAEFTPLPMEGGSKKYRSPDDNRRGAVLLMGAAAVVGVFGLVVWNAYREGVRPQDSNTAPLLETSGSFKSKPEETTGTKSAAEEASVFEQVEAPRPNVEPTPEIRPEIPPVETAVAPPPAVPAPKPVDTKTAPAPAASKSAATKPVETKVVETKPAQVAANPVAPKADAPISITPKPEASAAPLSDAFKPAFAKDGKFAVQIAAGATEAAAIGEWSKHVRFSPELFSGAERLVVQAEVNGKTVYRLRAGSFASSADADAFCSAFKAKGGACFRVAK
jgi:outer membrane biosynthesis protein TonB